MFGLDLVEKQTEHFMAAVDGNLRAAEITTHFAKKIFAFN